MKRTSKATPIDKPAQVYNDPSIILTPEDKGRLRVMLADPTYLKLLRFSERFKPSSNCTGAGSGERDAFSNERANARLGEIRGWELHIAAIFRSLAETPQPKAEIEANFPDSGTLDLTPKIPSK